MRPFKADSIQAIVAAAIPGDLANVESILHVVYKQLNHFSQSNQWKSAKPSQTHLIRVI